MANSAFDRAWSLALANRRFSLGILFVGLLAGGLLLLALLLATATIDLLVSQGTLVVPTAEQNAIAALLDRQPNVVGSNWVRYSNSGLLPLAWRTRSSPVGLSLARIYREIGPLQHNHTALLTLVVLVAATIGAYFFVSSIVQWSVSAAALSTGSQLREALYQQVMVLGSCDLPGALEPAPRELFTEKVDTIVAALRRRGTIVVRLLTVSSVLIVAALFTNLWITLAGMLTAGLSWWLLHVLDLRVVGRRRSLHNDRTAQAMSTLLGDLDRTPLVLGYGLQDSTADTFQHRLAIHERNALARDTSRIQLFPLVAIVFLVGVCLVVVLAGINVLRQSPSLSLATAVFLGSSLTIGLWPLPRISRALDLRFNAQRASREVYRYLDRKPDVVEASHTKTLSTIQQGIHFEEVTIRDRAGLVLIADLTLKICSGCHVALLSTDDRLGAAISCLFPRFRDPSVGRVLIDDVDLRDFSLDSVRQQVALVVQRGLLFTGTVHENITCGDPRFGLSQAAEAARQTQIYHLIQHLPNGFETVVGQHGAALAPWDAFRIGLARAVLRNPSVFVIEEPSATPDAATAERMEHCLGMLLEGRTAILLPTRLATLRDADQVVLLHETRLVAQGTHAKLLHRSDLYRHLLYLKFNTYGNGL